MFYRFYLFGLIAILVVHGVAERVYAQDKSALRDNTRDNTSDNTTDNTLAAPLPPSIGPIPSPRDLKNSLIISARNAQQFQDILVAPLARWLNDSKFAMRVVRNLDFKWEMSPLFNQMTWDSFGKFGLDEDRKLILAVEHAPAFGLPFGAFQVINQETDPEKKTYKILWNVQYAQRAAHELAYDVEVSWFGRQSLLRKANGIYYYRLFSNPYSEDAPVLRKNSSGVGVDSTVKKDNDSAAQGRMALEFSGDRDLMYQEALQLIAPPVVFGFNHGTWRFRGSEEDLVWIHSPVLGQGRKVLEANRSDPLIGGALFADDFLVWSTKIQSVDAKLVDEKVLLLPFVSVNPYRAQKEQMLNTQAPAAAALESEFGKKDSFEQVLTVRGFHQRSDAAFTTTLWNYENGQYPQAALWTPTTVTFVPRKVWIIELSSKNPFYSVGKQILIVDQESMLPFYKLVYKHGGEYFKTVLGGWALASSEDGKERFPFLGFVLAVEEGGSHVMSMTTTLLRKFSDDNSKASAEYRKLLNISNFEKKQEAVNAPTEKKELEEDPEAGPLPGAGY